MKEYVKISIERFEELQANEQAMKDGRFLIEMYSGRGGSFSYYYTSEEIKNSFDERLKRDKIKIAKLEKRLKKIEREIEQRYESSKSKKRPFWAVR